jgi:hypothetical protein
MSHPYASAAYARIFEDQAEPLWVPDWGAHVLVRDIPQGGRDAIGMYPLAPFRPGADLKAGLAWLKDQGLVTIGLVPDPSASPPLSELEAAFGLCRPFKTHFIVDYARPVEFTKHHRGKVKRAHEKLRVEIVPLAQTIDAWTGLYGNLIDRHDIHGLSAFSRDAFVRLAAVDGLTAVAAFADDDIVSMHLWVADPETGVGYSLLAATSADGYRRSAAYAVNDASIRLLSDLRLVNLGGGAGLQAEEDGLTYFKRGFSNDEVTAYFCAAVLDEDRYGELGGVAGASLPFPAYRFAGA